MFGTKRKYSSYGIFNRVTLVQCFANPGPALSPLIKNLGSAFKAYWAGATMNPFPIPPIPAPGAIQNIVVTQNLCINPGTWVAQFPTPPVLSSAFLVDFIILAAQIHLLTLKGMIYTTSMYPAAPSPVPAPGVIQWSGYIIPGGLVVMVMMIILMENQTQIGNH